MGAVFSRFRSAAELAVPSLMRPASETLHKSRHAKPAECHDPSKENRLEAAFHTKAQAIRSTIGNSALWRVQQMFFGEKLG
jgi:hypothetical protein